MRMLAVFTISATAIPKCSSRMLSLRSAPQISVSAGTRMPATLVSRSACSMRNGTTGRRRKAAEKATAPRTGGRSAPKARAGAVPGSMEMVVSFPSWELFDRQPREYRDSVLPPAVRARVAIEQASTFGWERYVGAAGTVIGMHTFGASAPLKALQQQFGFTVDQVVHDYGDLCQAVTELAGEKNASVTVDELEWERRHLLGLRHRLRHGALRAPRLPQFYRAAYTHAGRGARRRTGRARREPIVPTPTRAPTTS